MPRSDKPFFMDVNFMKMHNPTNPAPAIHGQVAARQLLRFDAGTRLPTSARIMDAIRAEAPDTIVIMTADNGAWQDA